MLKKLQLIFLFLLFFLFTACSYVGISPGIGFGFGSGGHFSTGISLNTWTINESFGNDETYKEFYIKTFDSLVAKYNTLIEKNNRSLTEIKELKIKMLALKHQVNTDWNDIEKRKDFINQFNKKIDFYINSLNELEK